MVTTTTGAWAYAWAFLLLAGYGRYFRVMKNARSPFRILLLNHAHPLLMGVFVCCCFWVGSCQFDPDEEFIPTTQSSLLLVKDETGSFQLWQQQAEVLNPDLGRELGIEVTDLVGEAEVCWLATGNDELAKFNLESNQIVSVYRFDTSHIHYVAVGSKYVVAGDTLRNSLLFVDKEDGKLIYQISLSASPRSILWRNQRFYVQVGSNDLHTFREETLSPLQAYTFTYPIVDMQADNGLSIWVHTQDTILRATAISVVTDQARLPIETIVSYDKIRYSPFSRDLYGGAFLEDIFLENGQLSEPNLPGVQDFEVDFFSGKIWISQDDTVKMVDISTGNSSSLRLGNPLFMKAYHYVAPKGE